MKISKVILLVLIFLFIGMSINSPSDNDFGNISQKDLDDFENGIGNYKSIEIEPNTVGSAGQKVESVIDSGFSYVFKIIKNVINDK